MRNLIWVALGFILGAATLGAVWANVANTPDDPDGAVDVRIVVERLTSGDVEVGLQQREVSGEWGETLRPEHRFLLAGAQAGRPLHSSVVIVDTDSRFETIANAYADYLFTSGQESARGFHRRLGGTATLPKLVCIDDLNDPGIGTFCEGMESVYVGDFERIEVEDYESFSVELETRLLEDRELGALFATSVPTANIVDEAREATRRFVPWSYWIELIDPHLPSPTNLHCVISHGSDEDLFTGLAAESSVAAAGMLGINMRNEVYTNSAEQADAVRRCAADGAVAIATTLADPEAMKPAVREAIAAGIPVISYNSGAEDAAEVGTALHISLDDHEAGRVAGEEFNRRGIRGQRALRHPRAGEPGSARPLRRG